MSLPKHKADYWEETYQKQQGHPWSGTRPEWWQPVIEKYQPFPKTVLDVGCGEGDKARWFAEQGYEVTGFDISQKGIETAQRHAQDLERPPTFIVGDMTKLSCLDLPQKQYGLILDVLASQFLPEDEEDRYLSSLATLLGQQALIVYKMLERKSENAPTIARDGLKREHMEDKLRPLFEIAEVRVESSANRKDTDIVTFFLQTKDRNRL